MTIAIVGGTGSFGRALASRLRDVGERVAVGSREAERGRAAGEELGVGGGSNHDVVRGAELVVLAVNADAAVATARELSEAIGPTPVLCVASELKFARDGARPAAQGASCAERVAEVVSGPVVAGLHSIAARNLADERPPEEDVLVCGDDAAAKERALALAGKLVAGRAVDVGPLASARALEGLTAVIVNVNRRYRAHAGLRVTGLPRADASRPT